jgi:orotate phosphoribosyltransferase
MLIPAASNTPSQLSAADLLSLVSARRGHFRMESGLHSSLWLDLDALFADPSRVQPFIDDLVPRLRPYQATVVCGPLLGGALVAYIVAQALGVAFAYTERIAGGAGLFSVRYRLPSGLSGRVRQQRVLLVDDAMSAGSSLRATHAAIAEEGGTVVAVAALLVLGDVGRQHFTERSVPVECNVASDFDSWMPGSCPLCASGSPIENVHQEPA